MHSRESTTVSYLLHDLDPSDWLRFVQLDPFPQDWKRIGLTDDDLRALEVAIMSVGERAPVVPGTGGLRKVRFTTPGMGRGKRDALRVCYALFPGYGIALLIRAYAKNEQGDLNAADRKAIAAVIKSIQHRLDKGVIR